MAKITCYVYLFLHISSTNTWLRSPRVAQKISILFFFPSLFCLPLVDNVTFFLTATLITHIHSRTFINDPEDRKAFYHKKVSKSAVYVLRASSSLLVSKGSMCL